MVSQRGDDDQAVDPVEQAAEAGQPGASVLGSELALQERLHQVAPDRAHRHDERQGERQVDR